MKILNFCPYYSPHIGGLENYADELNKHLSQKGADITVFVPHLPVETPEKETRFGSVKIIRFPAFEPVSNYPLPKIWSLVFWKLFLGLFRMEFDAVVSQTRFFSTSLLAFFYSKKTGKHWVHIEHGSDFVQSGNLAVRMIAKIYDLSFGKLVLNNADRVVAISNCAKYFVQKLVPKKECVVIYRGFDSEYIEFIPPLESVRQDFKNSIIIAYIGRLINGKGVADLIEAINKLQTKKKISCLIIGDGPQKNSLGERVRAFGLDDKIKFLGKKDHAEAIGFLKNSDIFINPSYTEGLPTTVVEAALCKKAVIATSVGGTAEIIDNLRNGILIKPRDVYSLRDKISELIEDPILRRSLGERAYDSVKRKFDWGTAVNKYLEILNDDDWHGIPKK